MRIYLFSLILIITFSCQQNSESNDKKHLEFLTNEYMFDRNLRFHYDYFISENNLTDSNTYLVDSLINLKQLIFDLQITLIKEIDSEKIIEIGGNRSWIRTYNIDNPIDLKNTNNILFSQNHGEQLKSMKQSLFWLISNFNAETDPLIFKKYKEIFSLYEMADPDGRIVEWEKAMFEKLNLLETIWLLNKFDRYCSEWIINLNK